MQLEPFLKVIFTIVRHLHVYIHKIKHIMLIVLFYTWLPVLEGKVNS